MKQIAIHFQSPSQTFDSTEPVPLTERILGRLSESRGLKIALWAAIPILRAMIFVLVFQGSALNTLDWLMLAFVISEALVYAYAIVHAIWGTAKITQEARAIEPTLAQLTVAGPDRTHVVFQGMGNAIGPIIMAMVVTLILTADVARMGNWWITTAVLVFTAAIHLPLAVWIWTYLMLMLGLNRLGARHLALEAYSGDKSLGLRPVGKLAFTGFWIFTAILVPILLISLSSVLSWVVGLVFFVAGVVLFFLSLWRVHAQMERAKQRQITNAHELYELAYEPLMTNYNLQELKDRSSLLGAAQALEQRAEAIQTWPFSDAVIARIAVIALGVLSAIVTRLVQKPLGL